VNVFAGKEPWLVTTGRETRPPGAAFVKARTCSRTLRRFAFVVIATRSRSKDKSSSSAGWFTCSCISKLPDCALSPVL